MTDLILNASALAGVVVLLVVECVRLVRGGRRERERDAALQRVQQDIQALCAGAVSVGKHLAAVDQKLKRLNERQDQLELRDPGQQTYGHAIRLAQRGANVDELIANCGLARGEAELLLRLHRGNEPH